MSQRAIHRLAYMFVPVLLCAATVAAAGPDVIVGDLPNISRWGRDATLGITAYSVGTISCNVGDTDVLWVADNNQHPVIAQNMYRLKNGRFEQVGQSWVKHGFTALTQSLCATCNGHGGSVLGVGCSDPYDSGLNGSQGNLGPRSEVNAATGIFIYPFGGSGSGTIDKRLQVHDADLSPALNSGALYFVEGQYVTHDDAAAGNKNNNASYRRATVSESPANQFNVALTDTTQRTKPAITAWKDHGLGVGVPDPDVMLVTVDVANDGRFLVASKATSLGGGNWHYEYAVQNLSSDRCAGSFSVPIPSGASLTNIGFHDVDSHTGEPYLLTDWAPGTNPSSQSWATQPYSTNVNANALRWGTLYNFRFDVASPPTNSTAVIGLFKPGPGTIALAVVRAPAMPDCNNNGIPDNLDVSGGTSQDCNGDQYPDECELLGNDCNSNGIPDDCDLAAGDCNSNSIPDACDAIGNDCDSNGRPDDCDLAAGDCNSNAIPDACDAVGHDCDGNNVPDSCQIDCDSNGVIDVCELAAGSQRDCNANGVPDNCDVNGIIGGTANYASPTINLNIPDNNATGVSSTLTAQNTGPVDDVNVRLDITHTFDGDLAITLQHGAATVTLANHVGGSGDNFTGTTFDTQAATAISSGAAPFSGTYRPSQSLNAFNGAASSGNWVLKVVDNAGADTGKLVDWTLMLHTTLQPPVSPDTNANQIPDECECMTTCVGDMNGDHMVNGDDIPGFLASYLGTFNPCADMDGSGRPLNSGDVATMADRLLTGSTGPCP